jgi:hypothetical protein
MRKMGLEPKDCLLVSSVVSMPKILGLRGIPVYLTDDAPLLEQYVSITEALQGYASLGIVVLNKESQYV